MNDLEVLTDSPMWPVVARTAKPPRVRPSIEDVKKPLDECNGRNYRDVRDRAIILTLLRLGLRVSELADMRLSDIEGQATPPTVTVRGKSGKTQTAGQRPHDHRGLGGIVSRRDAPEVWRGGAAAVTQQKNNLLDRFG